MCGRLLLWGTALVAALVVGMPPFRPALPGGIGVPAGAAAGLVLFVALAGVPILRMPALLPALWVAAGASFEELVWRGLGMGLLAGTVGVVAALAITTAGFALAHRYRPRARIHLFTGVTFGSAFACGGLAAAIAAHSAYNLLVESALRAAREPR